MRHQLKAKTPSARARMSYILRTDRYGVNPARAAEVVAAGVANLPSWADGPAAFWSAVDGFERKNARLCLELELNLPHELSRAGQVAAIADYIDRLSAEAGKFPITWGIHDDGGKNIHCHLMLQERPLDGRELSGPKAHFKRANRKNPAAGGVAKSEWWHKPAHVFWSRALWADACNQALLREGFRPRFDPRRKSERLDEALRAGDLRAAAALCTQTERHEGVRVAAARKKLESGHIEADDLPEQVMHIISTNDAARHYNCWLRDWSRSASDRELRLFLADHLHELKQRLEAESPSGHIQARAAWLEQQHAEALAENAERDALHDRLRHQLRRALAEGALDRAGGQAVLDRLVGADADGIRSAVVDVAELRAELAELVASETEQQAVELGQLAAVQAAHAEALAENAERDAELAQLVAGEQARHAADLEMLADRQALERHDARVDQARAKLAALASAPESTALERRADELEQDRAEWLQAHPVRAWLGLVPAAVSQDAIDRARAAAVAAADDLQRQIDQARAQLTAWLERAEQYRRQHWPGEYPPPAAPEPPQVAQEPLGRVETLRDSLQALQTAVEHHQPEWVVWDGEDVTYLYDAQADGWEQVQEPDPDDTPAPRGPRMR